MTCKAHIITELRAQILKKLKKGSKTVKNLYWDIGSTWHNTDYHLRVLQKHGLTKKEADGSWSLTDAGHETLQQYE